jgi:hypothetical protein
VADVRTLEHMIVGLLGRATSWAAVVKAALLPMKSFACWQEFHKEFEYQLLLLEARFVRGGKTIPVVNGSHDVGSPSVSLEHVGNQIAITLVLTDGA